MFRANPDFLRRHKPGRPERSSCALWTGYSC
jgi:hypothetical protein